MPNDKKKICPYCGEEKTLRGSRAHELYCVKNPNRILKADKSKPEPASKPAIEPKTDILVQTKPEPEITPQVKIEAKESKPKEASKPKYEVKKESGKRTVLKEVKESKPEPVSRKPADLFSKPAEKQAGKPEIKPEVKKAEKENKERGLFSFHRDD